MQTLFAYTAPAGMELLTLQGVARPSPHQTHPRWDPCGGSRGLTALGALVELALGLRAEGLGAEQAVALQVLAQRLQEAQHGRGARGRRQLHVADTVVRAHWGTHTYTHGEHTHTHTHTHGAKT